MKSTLDLPGLSSCSDETLFRSIFPRSVRAKEPSFSLSALDPRLLQRLETDLGLSRSEGIRILALLEWFRRSIGPTFGSLPSGIQTPEQAWRWFQPWLLPLREESFFVAMLDSRNVPFRCERIAEGCMDRVSPKLQRLFSRTVYWEATAILCFHNHPSRDPTPSAEDLRFTRRIGKAAELLGIRFLDHIVGSIEGAYSLAADRRIVVDGNLRFGEERAEQK